MHIFFGKKQREQRMARTDAQIQAILAPADERVAVAKRKALELSQLIDEVKATNDIAVKFYLATNRGQK